MKTKKTGKKIIRKKNKRGAGWGLTAGSGRGVRDSKWGHKGRLLEMTTRSRQENLEKT